MDPSTIAAATVVLSKALTAGRAVWNAAKAGWQSEEKDVEALVAFVELWSASKEKKAPTDPRLAARYLTLVAAAFGAAWRDHWADNEILAPNGTGSRWYSLSYGNEPTARARRKQVDLALSHALGTADPRTEEHSLVDGVQGDPVHSAFYRELWRNFTDPLLQAPGETPLLLLKEGSAREFERKFRIACLEALSTRPGAEVRDYIEGLKERRAADVRELFLASLVSWKQQHVFGTDSNGALPSMPLQEMYVEPVGTPFLGSAQEGTPGPILDLIDTTLRDHPLVVVTGDFGHGKSLTARMAAARWAHEYLRSSQPSVDLVFPVFIKCSEDLASHHVDLEHTVRRALKRLAMSIGHYNDLGDAVFALPNKDQRTVFILDGLDEVLLTERQIQALFETLWEHSSERHRFVIFSRPAAAHVSASHLDRRPARIELRGFRAGEGGGQVAEWIERWNGAVERWTPAVGIVKNDRRLRFDDILRSGLLSEAATPILLFMIAYAMTTQDERKDTFDKARLYDIFFEQLARSKHEFDRDQHAPVAKASEHLLSRLQKLGELRTTDAPRDAMLWLMAKTAWRARQLAADETTLELRHVDEIVHDELRLRDDPEITQSIRIGLLLSLQADFGNRTSRILFGHRSFSEYLVARFWANRLPKDGRCDSTARDGAGDGADGRPFVGGRRPDAHVLDASSEATGSPGETGDRLVGDGGLQRRRAAGARRASARGSPCVAARSGARDRQHPLEGGDRGPDPVTLRSLLAWFWLTGSRPIIFAPRLRASGADLTDAPLWKASFRDATLDRACFRGARLEKADFLDANLTGADLSDAVMWGATMARARASGASFEYVNRRGTSASLAEADDWTGVDMSSTRATGAVLRGFQLSEARFDDACLQHADLQGATLTRASLARAQCRGAPFQRAMLSEADCREASMVGANLETVRAQQVSFAGADLREAIFTQARLGRVNFAGARLDNADFRGAKLVGIDLRGAQFRNANVTGASFDGVLIDNKTDITRTDPKTASLWLWGQGA